MLCIAHNGHGCGNSLIAGAGNYGDRHFTAAHAGIGTRRSICLCLSLYVRAVFLEQYAADVCSPVAPEAFLGDGGIAVYLPVQRLRNTAYVHGICKLDYIFNIEYALILKVVLGRFYQRLLQQDIPVFLLVDYVGMVIGDMHHRFVRSCIAGKANIQHAGSIGAAYVYGNGIQICLYVSMLFSGHRGNDLQYPVGLARHYAHGYSSLYALEAAGIGHHHALYVFKYIAAYLSVHPFRHGAQNIPEP